jgi:hypothetical protein
MPSQMDVFAGVLESLAATIVLLPIGYFVKWVTEHPATFSRAALAPPRHESVELPYNYPATAPLDERLSWLEYRADEQSLAAAGLEGKTLVSRCSSMLENLSFLAAGDEVRFREEEGPEYVLTLESKLGDGPVHQTWKAVSTSGKRVALKFLKEFSPFATSTKGFFAAAYLANRACDAGADLPFITFNSMRDRNNLPGHYARELIEGESLHSSKSEIISQTSFEEKMAIGLAELAESLSVLEEQGITVASISPESIIVRRFGGWRLVDLDHAVEVKCYAPGNALRSNEIRYAPPEVLLGETPGPQAHPYCLARIVLFIYWPSDDLPSPYEALNSRVIDQVNCGLFMKRVLRKATCLHPQDRYENASSFVAAVQVAIQKGGSRAPVTALLLDERDNTWRLLRHTFWGTAIAMLIVRPPFAVGAGLLAAAGYRFPQYGLVELSNRFFVGAFHGVIGGMIWGTMIPGAFLLYWASHLRTHRFGPAWAALMCALAGCIGGILCAFGSVLITNATTLHQLGWLLSADDQMGNWARFSQTIITTHMFFAFPLTGTLTGISAALFLSHSMEQLVRAGTKGLDPVPIKLHLKEVGTIFSAMSFVLKPSPWLVVLLLPTFSAVTALWLHGSGVPLSAEEVRAFGEGLVHMFGLIGLAVGFFVSVRANPRLTSADVWQPRRQG